MFQRLDLHKNFISSPPDSHKKSNYFLMKCILCKERENSGDVLQLLSPLDISYYDDCKLHFDVPDLFIHQKCLFYLIFGSKKPKSFEFSRVNNDDLKKA